MSSIAKVRESLRPFGFDRLMVIHDQSSATVELAAQAIGCEPAEIAKTMAFFDPGMKPFVIVCAGDMRIDNRAFKDAFGHKAKMIPFTELEEAVGHPVGGVCPFGVNADVRIYLDQSLQRFERVYLACGADNATIGLTIPELESCVPAEGWVNIGKAAL